MSWKETWNHCIPHMMMTLKGIFKGKNNLRWNFVPLEYQTKSVIYTRRWISWILYRMCKLGKQEGGFLFAMDNGRKARIGDYDPMFIILLDQGQKIHPELFTTGVFFLD